MRVGSIVRLADSWTFLGVAAEIRAADEGLVSSAAAEDLGGVCGEVLEDVGDVLGLEVVFRTPEVALLALRAAEMLVGFLVVVESEAVRGGRVRRVGAIRGRHGKKRDGRKIDTLN